MRILRLFQEFHHMWGLAAGEVTALVVLFSCLIGLAYLCSTRCDLCHRRKRKLQVGAPILLHLVALGGAAPSLLGKWHPTVLAYLCFVILLAFGNGLALALWRCHPQGRVVFASPRIAIIQFLMVATAFVIFDFVILGVMAPF